VVAFCQLALELPRLEMETSTRHWRELSTYCATAMLRLSFSWLYTLFTQSAEGVGKVYRSAAITTTFWLALVKEGRCTPSG
jgi:hypothetical protein